MDAVGINIENVSKVFPKRSVIQNLNLSIQAGSFVSIVGPSGCGKSTLLRLIAGLEHPSAGRLTISPQTSNPIGFVFQEPTLLPWLNVAENIALPLKLSKKKSDQMVNEALEKVKLQNSSSLFPHELSGGMKMRASLARALVHKPKLLLMDEPFAALDENTRFEMQDQLLDLWKQEDLTVIFVTHSLFEAVFLSQRIIMLKGEGAKIALDRDLQLPMDRTDELRTSESLNSIVRDISARLKNEAH